MERYLLPKMAFETLVEKSIVLFDQQPTTTAAKSFLYNARFDYWHRGDVVEVPSEHDRWIAGGWICTTHSNGPNVTASKNHPLMGGVKLAMKFTAAAQWVYLRQLVPALQALRGKTVTLTADVTLDGPVQLDVYGQARYGTSDDDRQVAVDCLEQSMIAGRRIVAITFPVPDLNDVSPSLWTDKNCLELALRFKSTAAGTRTAIVHSMTLSEGDQARGPEHTTMADEVAATSQFYESGFVLNAGMNANVGQKRATALYKVRKAKQVTLDHITVTDLLGNVDRISIYDQYGFRSDNIPYTAIQGDGTPGDGYRNGFTVVKNGTNAAGIAFLWTVERW